MQLGPGVAVAALSMPQTRLYTLSLFGQMALERGIAKFQMANAGYVHAQRLFGISSKTVFEHSMHG